MNTDTTPRPTIDPERTRIAYLYRHARTHVTAHDDAPPRLYPDKARAKGAIRAARAWRVFERETAHDTLTDTHEDPGYPVASVYNYRAPWIPDFLDVEIRVSYDTCDTVHEQVIATGARWQASRFCERDEDGNPAPPRRWAARVESVQHNIDAWIWPDPDDYTPPAGMARGPAHLWREQRAREVAERMAAHFNALLSGEIQPWRCFARVSWRGRVIAETDSLDLIETDTPEAAAREYLYDADGVGEIRDVCNDAAATIRAMLDEEASSLARAYEALGVDQSMHERRANGNRK